MYVDQTLQTYLDDLASSKSAPGGGSAAAVSGAMAAGLASMVARLTQGKKNYDAVQAEIASLIERSEELRQRYQQLMAEDIGAYNNLVASFRMPRDTEEQRQERESLVQKRLIEAALVPLEMTERAAAVAQVCQRIAEIGNVNVLSDIAAAAMFALSSGTAAGWMVRANLRALKNLEIGSALGQRLSRALDELTTLSQQVTALVGEKA